jgi:hypothetical protein
MRVRKTSGWVLAAALLAAPVAAEPLAELRTTLAGLRAEPGVRLKVDVALAHQGVAPLHWSGAAKRGRATVVLGKRGARVRGAQWVETEGRASVWRQRGENDTPLLTDEDADGLVDPAGTLLAMLDGATLLGEDEDEWNGRPVRKVTFRPGLEATGGEWQGAPPAGEDGELPIALAASVWLDEAGAPLGMERSSTLRLGPALEVTQHQKVSYQQVGGHLFVAESADDYAGNALFVLRGRDARRMWVTAVE